MTGTFDGDMSTEVTSPHRAPVRVGDRGLQLTTIEEMWRFAQYVAKSGMAPKAMDRPEQVLVALQTGMEAGLSPMAALRSIVVINGVPSWRGDMALALVRSSGRLAHYEERIEGEADARRAVVITQRRDQAKPVVHTFSVADAKRARLWGKQGPWTEYPDRMLHYRALGFALRDQFSDVLQGGAIAEEVQDYPVPREVAVEVPPPRIAPTVPDPVIAEIAAAPFPSHAEADKAIAEADPEAGG